MTSAKKEIIPENIPPHSPYNNQVLSFDNLWHRRKQGFNLGPINIKCETGKVTALIGPNGSGKSTLLQLAAGLLKPGDGTIHLSGHNIADMSPIKRAQTIGYLEQNPAIAWDMNIRDIVGLGRYAHDGAHPDHNIVEYAIRQCLLSPLRNRKISELSGGERARVMLARLLAGRQNWMIIDEPFANLDPHIQLQIAAMLRHYTQEGNGLLISLHDLRLLRLLADDIIMLKGGELFAYATVDELYSNKVLGELFDLAPSQMAHFTGIESDRSMP